MKIGLLLPISSLIVRLAPDIRRQLSLGIAAQTGSSPTDFAIRTTAGNASRDAVEDGLQNLLIRDEADLVVLPLNPGLVPDVARQAQGQDVPAIVLNLGEDICVGDTAAPDVFVHSLGIWRAAWLSGWQAVRSHGPDIAVVTGAHEAGYGLGMALGLGAVAAEGAVSVTVPLHPSAPPDEAARAALDIALDPMPDALAVLASGETLAALGAALASRENRPPLIALPPHALLPGARFADPALPPHSGVIGWNPAAAEAQDFATAFHDAEDRPAHAYALLAREAGGLIGAALAACDTPPRGARLRRALLQARATGPRGPVAYSVDTQEALTPHHAFQARAPGTGLADRLDVGDAIQPPDALDRDIARLRVDTDKSGWLNPYLIA